MKRILCFKTLTNAKVIHVRTAELVKTSRTVLTAPASPDVRVIPAKQVGPSTSPIDSRNTHSQSLHSLY